MEEHPHGFLPGRPGFLVLDEIPPGGITHSQYSE